MPARAGLCPLRYGCNAQSTISHLRTSAAFPQQHSIHFARIALIGVIFLLMRFASIRGDARPAFRVEHLHQERDVDVIAGFGIEAGELFLFQPCSYQKFGDPGFASGLTDGLVFVHFEPPVVFSTWQCSVWTLLYYHLNNSLAF